MTPPMTPPMTQTGTREPLREADLGELERLAKAATPGPWTTRYGGQNWWIASCGMGEEAMTVWSPNSPTPDHGGEREDDGGEADRRNAAYIAALSPDVVLRLIAAARLDVERLREALSAVGDRHHEILPIDAADVVAEYARLGDKS